MAKIYDDEIDHSNEDLATRVTKFSVRYSGTLMDIAVHQDECPDETRKASPTTTDDLIIHMLEDVITIYEEHKCQPQS